MTLRTFAWLGLATFVVGKRPSMMVLSPKRSQAGSSPLQQQTQSSEAVSSPAASKRNILCRDAKKIETFPFDLMANVTNAPRIYSGCHAIAQAGAWYRMVGDGRCYATRVSPETDGPFFTHIMKASNGCGDGLYCVAAVENYAFSGLVAKWRTQVNAEYFVHAGIWSSIGGDKITGELSAVPCSGLCEGAISVASLPALITGDTTSTGPIESGDRAGSDCSIPGDSNVEFHSLRGSGSCMEAVVMANFDARLTVLQGECGKLKCLDNNRDKLNTDNASLNTLRWFAPAGINMKVLVHGGSEDDYGPYSLTLNEVSCPVEPLNFECNASIRLGSIPAKVSANLEKAKLHNDAVKICAPTLADETGVWYDFLGDGSCVLIDTENDKNGVAVFSGDCGDLSCAGFEYGAEVPLQTSPGVLYHVLASSKEAKSNISLIIQSSDKCKDEASTKRSVEANSVALEAPSGNSPTQGNLIAKDASMEERTTVAASVMDSNEPSPGMDSSHSYVNSWYTMMASIAVVFLVY